MAAKQLTIYTGKRKTANARVRITPGSGSIKVNGKNYVEYFSARPLLVKTVEDSLRVVGLLGTYDVMVNVHGGGVHAQADAIRHGVAKAILAIDSNYHDALKRNGYLTRDPRVVERKKYGRAGARKKFQFSKR